MMYNDEMKCPVMPSDGAEPVSAMMDCADKITNDALLMAKKINVHLFGKTACPDENIAKEVKCFADAMMAHKNMLCVLTEELSMMMMRLGV